jgi:hypothetical protein
VNSVEAWLKSLNISRATHCLRFAMPMVFIVGNVCFVNCFIVQRYFLQKIDLKLQIHEKESLETLYIGTKFIQKKMV